MKVLFITISFLALIVFYFMKNESDIRQTESPQVLPVLQQTVAHALPRTQATQNEVKITSEKTSKIPTINKAEADDLLNQDFSAGPRNPDGKMRLGVLQREKIIKDLENSIENDEVLVSQLKSQSKSSEIILEIQKRVNESKNQLDELKEE